MFRTSVCSLSRSENVNVSINPPSVPVVPDGGETSMRDGGVLSSGPPGGGETAAHLRKMTTRSVERFKMESDHTVSGCYK